MPCRSKSNPFLVPIITSADGTVDWSRGLVNDSADVEAFVRSVDFSKVGAVGRDKKGRRNANDVRKLRDRLRTNASSHEACQYSSLLHIRMFPPNHAQYNF